MNKILDERLEELLRNDDGKTIAGARSIVLEQAKKEGLIDDFKGLNGNTFRKTPKYIWGSFAGFDNRYALKIDGKWY